MVMPVFYTPSNSSSAIPSRVAAFDRRPFSHYAPPHSSSSPYHNNIPYYHQDDAPFQEFYPLPARPSPSQYSYSYPPVADPYPRYPIPPSAFIHSPPQFPFTHGCPPAFLTMPSAPYALNPDLEPHHKPASPHPFDHQSQSPAAFPVWSQNGVPFFLVPASTSHDPPPQLEARQAEKEDTDHNNRGPSKVLTTKNIPVVDSSVRSRPAVKLNVLPPFYRPPKKQECEDPEESRKPNGGKHPNPRPDIREVAQCASPKQDPEVEPLKGQIGDCKQQLVKIKKVRAFTEESAAVLLQAVCRGYSVRKSQPLTHLRIIQGLQVKALELQSQITSPDVATKLSEDKFERIRFSETIMALLLQLDAIQGAHPFVRERRKALAKDLIRMQERLDDLGKATVVDNENASSHFQLDLEAITDTGAGSQENVLDNGPKSFDEKMEAAVATCDSPTSATTVDVYAAQSCDCAVASDGGVQTEIENGDSNRNGVLSEPENLTIGLPVDVQNVTDVGEIASADSVIHITNDVADPVSDIEDVCAVQPCDCADASDGGVEREFEIEKQELDGNVYSSKGLPIDFSLDTTDDVTCVTTAPANVTEDKTQNSDDLVWHASDEQREALFWNSEIPKKLPSGTQTDDLPSVESVAEIGGAAAANLVKITEVETNNGEDILVSSVAKGYAHADEQGKGVFIMSQNEPPSYTQPGAADATIPVSHKEFDIEQTKADGDKVYNGEAVCLSTAAADATIPVSHKEFDIEQIKADGDKVYNGKAVCLSTVALHQKVEHAPLNEEEIFEESINSINCENVIRVATKIATNDDTIPHHWPTETIVARSIIPEPGIIVSAESNTGVVKSNTSEIHAMAICKTDKVTSPQDLAGTSVSQEQKVPGQKISVGKNDDYFLRYTEENNKLKSIVEKLAECNNRQAAAILQLSERIARLEQAYSQKKIIRNSRKLKSRNGRKAR